MPDETMNRPPVFRWRRLDVPGLEILRMTGAANGSLSIQGQCIDAGDEPFCVRHEWTLDRSWRSKAVRLAVNNHEGERHLRIERLGNARWLVEGRGRPDLDGCQEIDLSFTPICNSIALHQRELEVNESFDLTTLYVRLPDLFVAPSRQRYLRTGETTYRYIDLGLSAGFEATLQVDAQGFIRSYEGLFELVGEDGTWIA